MVRTALSPIESLRVAAASNDLARESQLPGYRSYVQAQLRHTMAKANKDASFRLRPYIDSVKAHGEGLNADSSILCVGSRNEIELDIFAENGFRNVTAIDLWSTSPRLLRRDMHDMGFDESTFDLVFASHSFEHSYDFRTVASECTRVLRDGGYVFCAVPVDYETDAHDRYDFKDAQTLLSFFPGRTELVFEEKHVYDASTSEMEMMFRVHKPG